MRIFLLGHPVAHSISPAIQNAALRATGLPPDYALLDVPPEELPRTITNLRHPDIAGCNVTVPHKQAVIHYLDELSTAAERIGAVNTIANRDGHLVGYNTDASGFLAALHEEGVQPQGLRVALLGAGGAARAIAFSVVRARVASLTILNRNAARAKALADEMRQTFPNPCPVDADGLDPDTLATRLPHAQLIVNATTVGLHDDESPLSAGLVPSGSIVCDIIYNPPETALLRYARAAGARTINGLGMLVHQAAAAFSIWTAQPAPVPIMRQAALEALEHMRANS